MKKFSFVLLLLFTNHGFAQNFNKLFILDSEAVITTGVNVINDKIYVTGYKNDSAVNTIKSFVAKFDATGNLLNYHYFRDNKYRHFVVRGTPYLSNNEIFLTGYLMDSTTNYFVNPTTHVFLLKVVDRQRISINRQRR